MKTIGSLILLIGLARGSAVAANEFEVPAEVVAAERNRVAAIAKAIPSAVSVFSATGGGGGSAVVISRDGYALSNFHVTSPVGRFLKCGLADGHLYDAVIVGIDPTGDVALIKLLGKNDFIPAEYGNSDDVAVGDWCFAVGNPFLLATDFQPTVTYGIVSGVHRYQYPSGSLLEYADCIQTDASINPGNSGGPLFNAAGQLIGINGRGSFAFDKRGRVNVGLGYAISINQIKNFLGHLKSGRIVDHATLGATVSSDGQDRVVVSNILESSDAYRRGLRYGDEIVSFGGRAIDSVNAFKNVLGIFPRGWRVPLSFLHGGEQHDVHVRLAGVHAPEELLRQLRPNRPRMQPGPPDQPRKRGPRQPEDAPPDPEQPTRRPAKPPGMEAIPEHLARHFEARSGFANFAFNRANQTRVWQAFTGHGQFAVADGSWILAGSGREEEIRFELGENESTARFGDASYRVSTDTDLAEQLGPQDSGGLLVALHIWRRMLVLGPQQFGDVYYLGTSPLPATGNRCDTLVATHDVVETNFYFNPETGFLECVEMFPHGNVDPCEVYFEDYRRLDGRELPHRLLIRYGDRVVEDIQLNQVVPASVGPAKT